MNKNILSDDSRRARALLAKTLVSNPDEIDKIIQTRFGWDAMHTKAAVGAFTSDVYVCFIK